MQSNSEHPSVCLQEFELWLEKNSVWSLLQAKYFPTMGMGAIAKRSLKQGETFLEIPVELIVSTVQIQEEWAQQGFYQWPEGFAIGPLVIWLLQEKKKENLSYYKPYIDMLPPNFDNIPLCWNEAALAEAKGTGLAKAVRRLRNSLYRAYIYFEEHLGKHKTFLGVGTFDEFIWAYNAMNSRWWEIVDEKGTEGFIVPGADICNHKVGGGIGFFTENQKFGFKASHDHLLGDQVYSDYGALSNFELLSTFGFVLDENPFDSVCLKLPFHMLAPSLLSIIEPLLQLEKNYRSATLTMNELCPELLRFFRLLHLSCERTLEIEIVIHGQKCSDANENAAVASAIVFLEERERRFKTSITDDLMLLNSLPLNNRNSVLLRQGQKLIIAAQKAFLIAALR